MPSLEQNLSVWGAAYDWSLQREEWSDAWGGVSHQLAMAGTASVDLVFSFDSLVHAEADVIGGYLRAALVERAAVQLGLRAISQERVAWGHMPVLNDCFSTIARAGSRWDRDNVIVDNPSFGVEEIAASHRRSTQYPPSRRDVRFGAHEGRAADARRAGERALELLRAGDADRARRTLYDHLHEAVDADVLNDLAVLTMHAGDRETAADLLRALVHLHPKDETAAQHLALLSERSGDHTKVA